MLCLILDLEQSMIGDAISEWHKLFCALVLKEDILSI